VSFTSRVREIARAVKSARFPPPPKRRHDLVSEGLKQAITGEGGGRGAVRRGGVEDPPTSQSPRPNDT
jgi:hypothetical protein